ncbi:diguanylate cyclase domain-containing protein [Granulicella sibirica]|uniref:Diguanylate cyclase/phosphodiesterase (GGDEF & EAL domains) with PAS/PAC sensor(S) n=1 Tax=Granulicella sibirica TaxID=2479048 RepID=A0A4V1L670_9BACT|nr:diguanylate cyclase [Granulicella sibirica]RXH58234.1 diguanylate cyclase/phosphodiesterase (GGDEF & EAL domains) with PAS/PAC sensor(s) [Granulicella sibirica]
MPTEQFRALELIVRAAGEAVSKEQFRVKVWQDRFVDGENLAEVISQLRRALGRQSNDREYIETVPRKGYRLDPQVSHSEVNSTQNAFVSSSHAKGMDEEHYRILVDSIEDYAIYMLDCGGRVCSWNLGAERNKGYTADEVIGQHYSMFFVADDIENRLPEKQLKAASQGGHHVGEGWRLRKNGERFWATFVVTAMRDSKRKLIGFAKVVRDISARKRQEEEVLQMEALVRRDRDRVTAAMESSIDAFYICEAVRAESGEIEDFIFTYLNSSLEKMVAITRDVLLNGKLCELLPIVRTTGLFDAYKRVVETGEPFVAEVPIHAESVLSEWIRVQAVRLEDGVAITASDVTERKLNEERLLHLAQHDPLTGLSNRTLLNDRISQAIERVKRFGGKISVCMIDLDSFKPVNDEHGHQVGDQVLMQTAQRLLSAVRATDSVIRVGGDEFVVVLPDNEAQSGIRQVSKKILAAISKPMVIEGQTFRVKCSLGIAIYPDDATEVQGLLSFADQAMYKMKTASKDLRPKQAQSS